MRRPADYAALVGLPAEGDYDSLIGYSSLAVRRKSNERKDQDFVGKSCQLFQDLLDTAYPRSCG